MASRHRRIQVSRDRELERAIVRGRSMLGAEIPSSQIVHALAVRGADAFDQDRQAHERACEFLIDVAEGSSGLDLQRLRDVRDRAWR